MEQDLGQILIDKPLCKLILRYHMLSVANMNIVKTVIFYLRS